MSAESDMDGSQTANGSAAARPGGLATNGLRHASFICAVTGERSKRAFPAREAPSKLNGNISETTPLLDPDDRDVPPPTKKSKALSWMKTQWQHFWIYAHSNTGRGILKCSLTYLLASLVTFEPTLGSMIGTPWDSKYLVATATIFFHPAMSIGYMHETTVMGLIGVGGAAVIGFLALAVSVLFDNIGAPTTGHFLVLVLFVGGNVGLIAGLKQHFHRPSVATGAAIASLGSVAIVINEASAIYGGFSTDRIVQVLVMIFMGIVIATVVNILVLPVSAHTELRKDFQKHTNILGEMLIHISRAFLSGREEDLEDEEYTKLQEQHQQSFRSMVKNLEETRNESLLLGKEKGIRISYQVRDQLDRLSQDLGGLRSAAFAQFTLINSHIPGDAQFPPVVQDAATTERNRRPSWYSKFQLDTDDFLYDITRAPDSPTLQSPQAGPTERRQSLWQPESAPHSPAVLERQESLASASVILDSPADMFYTFIRRLGPPTMSLVFTLKQVLDDLPFQKRPSTGSFWKDWLVPDVEVAINDNFHASLGNAVELYRVSRKDALNTLYASRALSAVFAPQRSSGAFSIRRFSERSERPGVQNLVQNNMYAPDKPPEDVLADIEEVSACCGHFSFSLLDFAEDVSEYLRMLDELKDVMEHPKYTWSWLMFWRMPWRKEKPKKFYLMSENEQGDENGPMQDIPEPIKRADDFADPDKTFRARPWYTKIHRWLEPLRREDVKYAFKVGLGAAIISLPAFINSSGPFFVTWKGEWALISYMAVCCMTMGDVNILGISRFIGTALGGLLAIIAWVLAAGETQANPYLLAFLSWMVGYGCFYLMFAKHQAPMGRFILLTYNIGALYAYSSSLEEKDEIDDNAKLVEMIFPIVGHRMVAVCVGITWAMIVTCLVWPISARRKIKDGLCLLWLRMSLIWKRDPLAMFLLGEPRSSYMDIREEASLHSFFLYMESLQHSAASEFELRGPFPNEIATRVIERTRRMLDAFHALNVVIEKDLQCTPGEAAVLKFTRDQRFALSARISHLFSVLASSLKLEYPLNDILPSIENSRDALLARMSEFRRTQHGRNATAETDYQLLYAYVLVTGQLAQDIEAVIADIEKLFGTLNEENLKLL